MTMHRMMVAVMALVTVCSAHAQRAISVSFGADRATVDDVDEQIGHVPVAARYWVDVTNAGNTGGTPTALVASNLMDNAGGVISNTLLYACSRGGSWNAGNTSTQTGKMLYGYLDDSASNPAGFKLTGIPFAKYRVIIYRNGDTWADGSANRFRHHTINGTTFSYVSGVLTPGSTADWGVMRNTQIVVGENTMVVDDLSGDLTVLTAAQVAGVARACISGFQIQEIQEATWVGNADGNWNNAGNWLSWPLTPTNTLLFSGSAQIVNTNDFTAGTVFAGLKFQDSNWNLSGNALKLNGNISVLTGGSAVTVGTPVILTNYMSQVSVANGSTLTLSGGVSEQGGARGMYKVGAGTLKVTADAVLVGPLVLAEGLVEVGTDAAAAKWTVGALKSGTASTTLTITNANSALIVNGTTAETFAGTLKGNGGLVKYGTGTLTLTAANTYSGGTVITGGVVQLSGATATLGTGAITNSGTIELIGASFGRTVTGLGTRFRHVSGTSSMTGTGSFSEMRIENNGTLTIGSGANLSINGTAWLTSANSTGGPGSMNGGIFNATYASNDRDGRFTFTQSGGTATIGALCGNWASGGANTGGSGGNSTYNLNGGTLILSGINGGNGGTWGDKGITISFGGGTLRAGANFTLNINNSTFTGTGSVIDTAGYTLTVSKNLSGTGGFTKTGAGFLVLGGSNTFSGMLTLNTGTIQPKHFYGLGTGDLTLGGGTLDLTSVGTVVPTLQKGWTVNGSSSIVKLAHNAASKMTITNIVGSGTVALSVDVSGVSALGAYKLINTTKDITTNNFTLAMTGNAPGFEASLTSDSAGIYLNVTGLPAVSWNVNGDGAWDTTTANWSKNGVGGFTFADNDFTILPDRPATASATLTLSAPYTTGNMTVSATNTAYTVTGSALTATRVVLDSGASLTMVNDSSRINANLTIPQRALLGVPSLAVLAAGFTPAVADYPLQSRLRFVNGSTLTSLSGVEGVDAQVELMKGITLTTNYFITGGQTLKVSSGANVSLQALWLYRDCAFMMDGGSLTIADRFWGGNYSSGDVVYWSISGGTLTVNGAISDNRDTWYHITQTGGSVIANAIQTQRYDYRGSNGGGSSGNSSYTLNGGIFTVKSVDCGTGGSWSRGLTLNLGNGTFKADASFTLNANTINLTGSGTFDTQAYNLTVNYPMGGVGGFTKMGAGTLLLYGNNSFAGPMTVATGKVEVRNLGALGSGNVTMSGGTLDLTTTGVITPSARDYALSSGTVKMKMNGSTAKTGCDLLQGGTITGPSGSDTLTFVLNFGGATKAQATYKLAEGTLSGVDTNRFVATVENGPTLNAYAFQIQGGALYVILSGPDYVDTYEWDVASSTGNWDKSSPNWKMDGTTGLIFSDGKGVAFKDVAGQPAVTVSVTETVQPATLFVENNATDYTFDGAYGIISTIATFAGSNAVVFTAPVSVTTASLGNQAKVTLGTGSSFLNAVAMGQKAVLTVPDTAAIPGGITPPSADYPNQALVRFVGAGTMYSLAEVGGKDAQIDLLKSAVLAANYTVSGGQTLHVAGSGSLALQNLWVGRDNRLILDSGSVTVSTNLWLNQNSVNGYGLLNVSGGSLTVNGKICDNRDSNFIVTQTGGAVQAASLEGTMSDAGNEGGGTGQSYYYLNGGSLTLGNLITHVYYTFGFEGKRRINLHVGNATYRASASHTINGYSTVVLASPEGGTATFDTQGYTLTLNTPLTGPGGFTKVGSGTLVLGADNTFTGSMVAAEGTLNVNAPCSMTNVVVNGGTVNLNTNCTMTGIIVNGGTLNMGAANASLATLAIAGGTVVPKHVDAFGSATASMTGGTLDVRAAGSVVPTKALDVSVASTLNTKFDNPPNLSVGTMSAVLTLNVDITGAGYSTEYKLLSASSTPPAEYFALAGTFGDKKAELVFKADGVYMTLKPASTIILLF